MIPVVYGANYEISYQGRVTNPDGSELLEAQNLTIEINQSNVRIYNRTWTGGIHGIGNTFGFDQILGRDISLSLEYNRNYTLCPYVNKELLGCYTFKSGVGDIPTNSIKDGTIIGRDINLSTGIIAQNFTSNSTSIGSLAIYGQGNANTFSRLSIGNGSVGGTAYEFSNLLNGNLQINRFNGAANRINFMTFIPIDIGLGSFGMVGIGTTTPRTFLDVNGNFSVATNSYFGGDKVNISNSGDVNATNFYGTNADFSGKLTAGTIEFTGVAIGNGDINISGYLNVSKEIRVGDNKVNLSSTGDIRATKFYGSFNKVPKNGTPSSFTKVNTTELETTTVSDKGSNSYIRFDGGKIIMVLKR